MPQFSQLYSAFRRVAIFSLIGLIASSMLVGQTAAQDPAAQNPTARDLDVAVGVGGFAKLGHWLPVTFKVPAGSPAEQATRFRVTTLDGDDTPNEISGPLLKTEDGFQGVIQFGRTYGDAKFEMLGGEGKPLAEFTSRVFAEDNQFMKLFPSTGRLLACVEPPVAAGAEKNSIASRLDGGFPGGITDQDHVASIAGLADLPQMAIAYESCESLFLLVNDSQWLAGANAKSIEAIETWVQNGGHFVIMANPAQSSIFQDGGLLQKFAPGKVVGKMDLNSSRRLEEFCKSNEPFLARGESMQVLQIEDVQGSVALGQGDVPLIVRRPFGLGEVTFIVFDPTEEKFSNWQASNQFMLSLMNLRIGDDSSQSSTSSRGGSAVRHSGYKDMAGQMKVPLERFTSLRFIPFALIATLIALYILCIGVGDWFFVGRVLKKHELTWITFPLLAALFCGLAWYVAKVSRPASVQINQVELVDIDSVSGHVRTAAWTNLYSPTGRTVDLSLGVADAAADRGLEFGSSRLSWLGLPGDGLGGMLNRANPGLYRTGYVQEVVPTDSDSTDVNITMEGVELQVSSTRPLFGHWNGDFENRVVSRLRISDRLEGTFTNPFDVPMKDVRLFYNDLVYVVNGSVPPDGDIAIGADTIEKTVRSYLTRRSRQADDKYKSQSVAWDTRDVNLGRIMQMMMFYHGAGGSKYTGLSHAYHDFIEMTPQRLMDRAILVGRLDDRVSTLKLDGEDADELYDSSLTLVRVLLPVERRTKSDK